MLPPFPEGFVVGVSTSAYQIEGATTDDGREPSIWDTFAHTRGNTRNGDTGDIACDHYHRWPEDLDLLVELGVDAYRFSIAWPRQSNLDFYDRLVDGLLARGITPLPTLYHWDLPQALEDRGGWLNRETSERFAQYAANVGRRLGDRVHRWITLNEPVVHMAEGYAFGTHAPGRTLMLDALPVAHHLLLAHGLAAQTLPGEVMLTNNCTPVMPASDDEADHAAAAIYDGFHNRLFNDPVMLGTYPMDVPGVRDGDMDIIRTPMHALGINYYNPTRIAAADGPLPFRMVPIEGAETTAFGWPVVPEGLYDLLTGLKRTYAEALPPIYITENGCSSDEGTADKSRIDYLDAHLRAAHRALTDGVDLRGFFVWSLLDNFEWSDGYRQRFGLVGVDFATQVRTRNDSFRWLRDELTRRRDH
ncbi:beta-glucosidase [Actinoplanes sp. TBRC 11911]|uniref:GH1 family beta-glucosidase n=1 Tax=Actinoplanes sp. TBRC 11911 TaxID=2729386 RepID=UPI00145EF0F1|nr:GH1 family beta-glucosidase [Actinoplanes sp. TBRC 11911]NMO51623.1 beta-glucosidase [Actinoplanes sp. TBRC 11911]